jgi:hypothetical protein
LDRAEVHTLDPPREFSRCAAAGRCRQYKAMLRLFPKPDVMELAKALHETYAPDEALHEAYTKEAGDSA